MTRTKEGRGSGGVGPGRGAAAARRGSNGAPALQPGASVRAGAPVGAAGVGAVAIEAPQAAESEQPPRRPELPTGALIAVHEIYVPDNDGRLDADSIASLADTMKSGLLNPITLRDKRARQGRYELVAGRRRLAAARLLEWTHIPAIVREMSDLDAQVARIVENEQREDLHPLDQATCYQDLAKVGLSIHKIARRVGRAESHVYDRLRLLDLTPEVQKLFRLGKIGIGHAIILARLKAKDQARAIEISENHRVEGGLFRSEAGTLWGETEEEEERLRKDPLHGYVARSVVELQAWVDEHVRLDRRAPDLPQLFPATAANLTAAEEKREKIIPITRDHHVQPEAKDAKERTYGPVSWKRADGSGKDARACEKSGVGVFVVGPGRGESLRVCVNKDCPVHWHKEAKENRARAKASASGNAEREARLQAERAKREAAEEALRARYQKAIPAILEAFAQACARADARPGGAIGRWLAEEATHYDNRHLAKMLSPGKSAESLVRWLAFMHWADDIGNAYRGFETMTKVSKLMKIDLQSVFEKAAPVKPAAADPPKAAKPARKKSGARP